jgi:5-methylcytosine-specific restriction endonuclease McrA
MNRNFNDPLYKNWRNQVYKRDKHQCQWPDCGSRGRLNAHHIRTWARNPALRFSVANGITLCWRCHKKVHSKEEYYERFFFNILLRKSMEDE